MTFTLTDAGGVRGMSTAALSEPERPDMKTEMPGPKSKQLLQELSVIVVNVVNLSIHCVLMNQFHTHTHTDTHIAVSPTSNFGRHSLHGKPVRNWFDIY